MDDDRERDEQITAQRIAGASVRALATRYDCTSSEIEEAIDRRLSYELDQRQRLRLVKLSVGRIETLMSPFYEKAVKDKDVSAGTLCCKLEERLAMLLGLDHPTTSRLDVYQVAREQKPSEYDQIRDAIMRVANSGTPAQRAVRKRLNELSPEEALALLGAPTEGNGSGPTEGDGNGVGRVDGNGGSDPTKPPR